MGDATDGVGAVIAATGVRGRRDMFLLTAAFTAVYLVWGSTYLAIAWAVETFPPMMMIGARCLLAGTVLYGWARARGGPRPNRSEWGDAALSGVLLFVTGQALVAWAETRVASGAVALLVATEPLFIALLGWQGGRWVGASRRGPRPPARTALALLVGFAGVAVMVAPTGEHRMDLLGAAAAIVAALSWSVGVLRTGNRTRLGSVHVAGMQLLAGGVTLGGVSWLMGEPAALPPGGPSARSLLAFAYLVVFGSIVTYAAYVWLLDQVGPVRLSTHAYVNPVVAVVLGALMGGEAITVSIVAASVLILGSVVVLVRRSATAEPRVCPEVAPVLGAEGVGVG